MDKKLNLKSEFLRNSIKMSMGVVISQAINMLYIPIFSRFFAQEAYALQGNFISILNIAFVVASMGLTTALAIPKKTKEIDLILKATLRIVMIACLVITFFLLLSEAFSLRLTFSIFKIEGYAIVILFPITLYARTFMFVYETRISLLGNFKLLSLCKVYSSLLYGITVFIAYYFFNLSELGLIWGNSISFVFISILLFRFYRVHLFSVKTDEIFFVLKRYKKFVFFSMPNMLLNAISSSIPIILLLDYYGKEITGDYTMAIKIVALPVSFIVASLRSVYLKKLTEVYQNDLQNFYKLIKKNALVLPLCGVHYI